MPPGTADAPGQANSRAKPNTGPAITDVRHTSVLPISYQVVTVSARVRDTDGLASLILKYRVDPSTNVIPVNMVNNGAGLFSGGIPGQAAGTIVAFSIEALDNNAPRQATRFPADAPARECLVRFGELGQSASYGTYRLWMTRATFDRWCNRERLSNKPLDCTFVYPLAEWATMSVCTCSARLNRIAMPRGSAFGSLSGISGTPVESENLTVTGVEACTACRARVSDAAALNGINVPVNKMPLAWTGLNPGCGPNIASNCFKISSLSAINLSSFGSGIVSLLLRA